VEEENMTASDPVFKPVTLPDFQNGNASEAAYRMPTEFLNCKTLL
jgi:hypothetical protein